MGKSSKDLTQDLRDATRPLVFFSHQLFAEASSEMVSMEGWLSRNHSQEREAGRKDKTNDTRAGLKITT